MGTRDDASILVCGAGTVGGTLLENLARVGFKRLAVVDCDAVEARNLANQPYFKRDVGQPKVRALADLVYRINGTQLTSVHKRLSAGNVAELISGHALVVDAFDNHASRKLLAQTCRTSGNACLHVGLSADGYAEVFWNDYYVVPPDAERDACTEPTARTLSLLAVAAATEALLAFVEKHQKRSFTVTLADMRIVEMLPV